MTTYSWSANTLSADWTDTSEWYTNGVPIDRYPVPGDAVEIGAGTVELAMSLFDMTVTLFQPATALTLTATGVELGDRALLLVAAVPGRLGPIVYNVIGNGTLDDAHAASDQYQIPGEILFAAAPLTIELSASSAIDTTATFINNGVVTGGALFLTVSANTTAATFVNNTTIDVTGPFSLAAGVTLGGSGVVDLDGTMASARLDGEVGSGQTFELVRVASDAVVTDTLTISAIAQFQGTVQLSREGQIVLPGMVSDLQSYADGVLLFANGSTLNVVPVQDADTVGAYTIPVTFSGPGETVVFATVAPCFCVGTRIATADGDVPVEQLRAGEMVRLARGGTARVVWVGRRDVSCSRHPCAKDVWPVRIHAGAVAPGVPRRDLLLSPDHAVSVAGHLIPVRHLANGATIVQEPVALVRYHHVELARHDLLLAEGLAAESYLDTGNRAAFADGPALALHADFSRRVWSQAACATLVQDGAALAEARRALFRQARRLGHCQTYDPALSVLADGRALQPNPDVGGFQMLLPPAVEKLRLCSRTWVPSEMLPENHDQRRLGVAIGQLWLDGREVHLDSPALCDGWHAAERHWRWTDGEASLAIAGVRTLRFTLPLAARYWREQSPVAVRRCA